MLTAYSETSTTPRRRCILIADQVLYQYHSTNWRYMSTEINCKSCHGKGFVENEMLKSAGRYTQLVMCPVCKNLSAYSDAIKKRYAKEAPLAKVIPFRRLRLQHEPITI